MSASYTEIAESRHPLHEKVGHLIRRLNQRMLATFSEQLADFEISNVQFAALEAINALGTATQKDIASYIAMEPSNTHTLLKRLRDRKLITIGVDRTDPRRNLVQLSAAGRDLLMSIRPFEDRVEPSLLQRLTETEKKQFVKLVKKLIDA